ncbi:MAG: hypothetical protein QNJ18_21965 [Xenococcaceae cyanobacterium MO_167.B52]|nr:hypothetical protein [Xenococcaceae cyanobacterium MO_167.B52]
MQNVFDQQVYQTVYYPISLTVVEKSADIGIVKEQLSDLEGETIAKAVDFRTKLQKSDVESPPHLWEG